MILTPKMRQDCSSERCTVFGILNYEFSKFFDVILRAFISHKVFDYIRNYTFRQFSFSGFGLNPHVVFGPTMKKEFMRSYCFEVAEIVISTVEYVMCSRFV